MASNPPRHLVESVDRLNDMLRRDPNAIDWLVKLHIKARPELAAAPGLQYRVNVDASGAFYSVGLLGVLNALLSTSGFVIVADYENDAIIGFRVERLAKSKPLARC